MDVVTFSVFCIKRRGGNMIIVYHQMGTSYTEYSSELQKRLMVHTNKDRLDIY